MSVNLLAESQFDDHTFETGRDRDEHIGILIRPTWRQADEDRRVIARRARGRGEGLHAPGANGNLDRHLVGLATGAGLEREADILAFGDLERLENKFLDAVGLPGEVSWEDILLATDVDGQTQLGGAGDAGVVDLGDQAGLVALGEGRGGLEVDEEVLADEQIGGGLAGEGVGAGDASGGELVVGERGRGLDLDRGFASTQRPVTTWRGPKSRRYAPAETLAGFAHPWRPGSKHLRNLFFQSALLRARVLLDFSLGSVL